jgi:hypothetical protein
MMPFHTPLYVIGLEARDDNFRCASDVERGQLAAALGRLWHGSRRESLSRHIRAWASGRRRAAHRRALAVKTAKTTPIA